MKSLGPNYAQQDEVEHFDDFTIASSWERFISDIEAVCRQWMADGSSNLLKKGAIQVEISKNLYKVKSDLKHVSKTYSMEFYFGNGDDGKVADWNLNLHDLQLCFGVKDFLVIAPQSASGVILDSPEASKLLSAVAIALSNCSSLWPAFVPVHDPSRKAYIGIQNMGTIFTRRFEADRMGSQVPVKLLHLEGLYELFVSKFAYSTLDLSVHLFKVLFTMKLTYKILPNDDDEVQGADAEITESGLGSTSTHNNAQWDDDCSWSDWYSSEDPVKGFELITIWFENMVENSLTMAELENFSPHGSKKWILFPVLSSNITNILAGNRVGFSSQLSNLIDTLDKSFGAQFMEDFISAENPSSDNLKSSMVLPPPTAIDRVLKELFHNGGNLPAFSKSDSRTFRGIKGAPLESLFAHFCLHALWFANCNIRAIALFWIEFVREVRWYWEESQPLPRMPVSGLIDLSTCLINQKLQMLAICIDQKRQPNEEYQDCLESQDPDSPQKEDGLTSEDSSIMHTPGENFDGKYDSKKEKLAKKFTETFAPLPFLLKACSSDDECESVRNVVKLCTKPGEGRRPADMSRRGSAGIVGNMTLLNSSQSLHAPCTQDAPLMTEDMHEERLKAVEAFGDSFNFSAQLEKDILASDMQAFKAANPDAVFEDFIRWHSPGDWMEDHHVKGGESTSGVSKEDLPRQGRLSKRMSEHGNLWHQIWNDAPALPVSDQKPLLDSNREGEKVTMRKIYYCFSLEQLLQNLKILHYLETLRPHQLLEQMVCTAFKASADTLNQTSFGGLKQMKTKMDQLYPTMASVLKPLQANRLSSGSEITEDLRRLCVVFEHVEKLLTLAASLHRKLGQAPLLSDAIFKDFYDFYLPRMGSGSIESKDQKEFDKKQPVRPHERAVVSNLFTPPTANQSWRKVLSMGNLLNGHEPILREIIFSTRDSMRGNHYAATTPGLEEKEIETYRMYVSGSSNDLRVALSVASCD